MFDTDANDATDDGSHTEGRYVKTGGKFDSDGEYGHHNFENQRQEEQNQDVIDTVTRRSTLHVSVDVRVIPVVITAMNKSQ